MEDRIGVVKDVFRPPCLLQIALAVRYEVEVELGGYVRDKVRAEVRPL